MVSRDEESIFKLYHRIHRELLREIRGYLEPYDFNRGELPVLASLIRRGDGLSQKAIRSDMPISKSTMSKTIDSLIQKGYLRKEQDPEDKRSTLIFLTEKGKDVEQTIGEINKLTDELMMEGFSQSEEEELRDHLKNILKNLED